MLVGGGQQLLPDEPSVSASSSEVVGVLEGVLSTGPAARSSAATLR